MFSAAPHLPSFTAGLLVCLSLVALKGRLLPPPAPVSADDLSDGFSEDEDADPRPPSTNPQEWGYTSAPYKLVMAVNMTLKMGKGKQCAQCCHAAVGCYKQAGALYPRGLKAWEVTGCAKVAVKLPADVDQHEEFSRIRGMCRERGVACYLVEDAGRTQIAAGSRTVIGVGPAPVEIVDEIMGGYKLL
ncbi:hypothetical protein TeGR_g9328 [Tetraparma gracilis]|uniref:peptidyl-tRNA hydrolase n=1 Tax=Tetraparma gracilis TaxID=2962635 RepID=A0ABQ6M7B5_9STRA|nr:hypothetical protein TeGR_g9328 [Tetraparma gracilis]